MDPEVLSLLANLFPMIAVIVAVSVAGWVLGNTSASVEQPRKF
jgi:hypothetical protein